ncbi:MAG: hypothetical protein ABW133_10695 [Polyangiaceae bacterium]
MVSNTGRFPWTEAIALATLVSGSGGIALAPGSASAGTPASSANRGESAAPATSASERAVAGGANATVAPTSGAATYLPTGPLYFSATRRPDPRAFATTCSFRHPVCVHTQRGVLPDVALGTLRDLERAAALLFDTLGLPAPLDDRRHGGGPAFDLYLVPPSDPGLGGALVATARDEPEPSPFDHASAVALMRHDVTSVPLRRHLAVRALASAIGWSIDAAEAPEIRESSAAYLAELTTPYGTITTELIDDFQAHPERAVVAAGVRGAEAVALPWYVDATLGSSMPGILPTALAVIAGQRTPDGVLRWNNEPDLFDALRGTLKARSPSTSIADFWMEFAIARLFMGSRDDGVHFPETAFAGSAGRIRFDWNVPFASLPRRLSPERPLDPTGSTYVWIDLQGAPPKARLVFHAEWEAPVPFRWALVRIAKDGSEASRVLITSQQKTTSAEKNLDALDGLAGIAVVGVNVGDLALDDPFDPDHQPYEPHGYVLTIAVEP